MLTKKQSTEVAPSSEEPDRNPPAKEASVEPALPMIWDESEWDDGAVLA
jgi:hypothetical protein